MALARGWIGSAMLAALVVLGMAAPAHAVSLWSSGVGGIITVNGLTITVTGCALRLNGILQGTGPTDSCNATTAVMAATATVSGSGITITGSGTNTNIFTAYGGSGLNDLNVTFLVSAASAKTTVNQVAATLTGSAIGANATLVEMSGISLGENYSGLTGASAFALALSSLPPASCTVSGTIKTCAGTLGGNSGVFTSIAPFTNNFSVTKDIRLNASGVNKSDTLRLSSVTQLFTPAPEPLSAATFAVGLAGLGALRRRRRRMP